MMKTYQNHRQEPYFTFLKNGQKTIEGRLQKDWYPLVRPGDHIITYSEDESDKLESLVKGVRRYKSIEEMLRTEPLAKMLPDIKTVDAGLAVYRQFYTEEQEKEFGAVAIEVEVIK